MQGVDQLHGSQTMVNRSVLLRRQSQDMHFRLHLAPESGSLGLGSVCFSKHPGDSEAHSTLRVSGLVTVSKTEISPPHTHTQIYSLWQIFGTFLVLNYSTGKTVPCRVIVRVIRCFNIGLGLEKGQSFKK